MKAVMLLLGFVVGVVGLGYFFWPVDEVVINSHYEVNGIPPMGGCFQTCLGYVYAKCDDEKYFCDEGKCYGILKGSCVSNEDNKNNPVVFLQSRLDRK